ncbi:MAG TPA: sporulation protein YunB [Bacillota bacterium]|jgi:sporulation protein YunB|nr:sporulation protein YunB [Bacillota bacterium]HOL08586.1 sporulation protein YunB [Bacillota bacterium]HPO97800.1 sporulation protein YunB [Bacillota bacterium]
MRFKLTRRLNPIQIPPYKRRLFSTVITVIVFILVSISSFYLLDFKLQPALSTIAEFKVRQVALQVINDAVRLKVIPNINYQSLVDISFDNDGKVSFIHPNTGAINQIAVQATQVIQEELHNLPKQKVSIPLGEALGIKLFANLGPYVPVKIQPIGFVENRIEDSFQAAGINQVRHQIFLTINANLKVVVPLVRNDIDITAKVPLVEAVIMGEVPRIYSGSGGLIIPGDPNLLQGK